MWSGLEQAKAYARMLDVPFTYASNGHGFVEFDFFLNRSRELETIPTPNNLWNRWQQMRITSRELYAAELAAETLSEVGGAFGQPTHPLLYPVCPVAICGKEPHYFQEVAIRRVLERITSAQKRILLTMATGTGKTFTAF